MERLTIPDKKIDGGLQRTVIDTREVRKYATNLYWALKKYEDTGLSPEQVEELKDRDTVKQVTDKDDDLGYYIYLERPKHRSPSSGKGNREAIRKCKQR